ncbi:hypothetical protein F5J12DRAFT_781686 [Pisolithus orientalis]|uniref:uncharacterized protein n=1 Tax=Pisolithus orientalis TaxID=936130 RepID=UPI00222472F9|nr:uncharacterized protein F5J12DRAFT_781686 [Pisolithus orientalis]KAI6010669.1 hypothetical protein F5J12DRAFT_781686 [Pisolithus orientalis]
MAPPPEIKKDKPKPWHVVQPPEGWEEHMFSLHDRRRSLTPSVSVSSQNSTTPILQEDQVEGALMEEDAGEAEAKEVDVNIQADKGSQHPDDGASQLPDNEDEDGSDSLLPPSLPPAEDSSSDAEDEFPPCHPGCHVEHKPKSKGKSRAMDVDNSDILNEANLFCSWYWATQLKPDGVNNIIMVEYNQLMKDIPKDNTTARKEKLKAIYEWSEKSSAVPANKSVKSIAVRVHNMKMQFSGLAEVWLALEDIKIAGVVMYVGQDPAGCQTSGIFGGSNIIQKYINDCAIDVQGFMDKYTAIFKCLRDGNGTEAGLLGMSASASSAVALELHCRMKEIPRDCNCQVFGSMMKEKLIMALRDLCMTCGVEVGDPQKIIWQQLLEFVRRNSLVIINWPLGVPPLGPGFEYKKLKADALCQLVVPYLQRKLGSMYDRQSDDNDNDDEKNDHLDGVLEVEIKPWNEDVISIGDAPPLKEEIALVKAPDGMVLGKVSDDPEWQKSHEEGDPGMAAPHAQSGILFPSCKQPCVEVMDNDTVPCEASHSDCQMPLHDKGRDACPIAGDCGVVVYPTAFWSKLTDDMHRMHFMTHQHTQATRTLESLVDLSTPCWLSTMGICIMMLSQAIHTHGTLALLSSFHHLGIMRYYCPPAMVWGISLHPVRHIAYHLTLTIIFTMMLHISLTTTLQPSPQHSNGLTEVVLHKIHVCFSMIGEDASTQNTVLLFEEFELQRAGSKDICGEAWRPHLQIKEPPAMGRGYGDIKQVLMW